MAKNLLKELEEAYTYDVTNGLLSDFNGKYVRIHNEVMDIKAKISREMGKICTNYGVLLTRKTYEVYCHIVLTGKMTYTNAMKKFKKDLYSF